MTAPPRITKPRPRIRRLLLGAALLAFVFAVALVTTPWWWPHAARSLLARQGVTFARFETLGYSRFALHDVRFANPTRSTTASIARLEADTPVFWLLHGLFSQPGPVEIHNWSLTLAPTTNASPSPDAPSRIDGWPALQSQLSETLATLQKWLPEARATDGTLLFNNQKLTAASLDWLARDAHLTATGLAFREHTARAELRWHATDRRLSVVASTEDSQWSVKLDTRDNLVTGRLHLWAQPLDLRATFPARGWIPTDADLSAPRLAIPGATFNLAAYYPTLVTEGRLTWQNARLSLALNATGQPAENSSAPPLQLTLAGHGDTASFSLERFDITLPGTTARLLAPIVLDRDARIRSGPSQFSIASDLEKLPGLPDLRGKLSGNIRVEPSSTTNTTASANSSNNSAALPRLTAQLEASDLRTPQLALKSAVFEATLLDSALTIRNARLAFADGSTAELEASGNWRERSVASAKISAEIKPAAFARWLPPSLTFSRLSVSAQASGRWPDLQHSGQLTATDVTAGTPKPVTASATWEGTGPVAEKLHVDLRTGDTSATLDARLTAQDLTLSSLALTLPDAPALTLARPARVLWQPALGIETLDLSGGDTRVSVSWSPAQNRQTSVELAAIDSAWLRDFLPAAWPRVQLDSSKLSGRWPSGVFEGTAQLTARAAIASDKIARLELAAEALPKKLRLQHVRISDATGAILDASGDVPLVLTPDAAPFWKLDPDGAWSLNASTTPDSPFWAAQAEASGLTLRSPKLSARIEGSVKKPDARIDIQAAEIALKNNPRLPAFTALDARLVLDEGLVELEKISLQVAGQPVSAAGRSLVPPDQWPAIVRDPRQLWSGDAEVRLDIPGIDIASISALLPDVVSSTGTFKGTIIARADGTLDGALTLTNAATHPIATFGSLSHINGELAFSGRKAALKSLTAQASGQPVKASGSVEFPATAPLKLDVTLSGKNLPLVRQTGLLIRADLDLYVKTGDDNRTTVGGDVKLHDSLFLRDVRSLIPTRGGGPSSRPPYFSVTAAPVKDWLLALKVGGDRFITLRTPLFSGVISGQFDLTGTFYEPIATGQVVTHDSKVLLPFAAFNVDSGAVRLTRADPYSPQIALNASARTLGYDVRMEITGPASAPTLEFSSSPPLSSEQVLLMVMAGETPRTDIAYTGSQRAQRIGTYLGKSLLSDFFGDPAAAEKLTITSGENVTDTGRETYYVEYKFNDRWSLVGERDEFDDYNAGIKFRLYTAKKKPADDAQKP